MQGDACAFADAQHARDAVKLSASNVREFLMSAKRALVVDDSKSARAFLSRILERHEITVDAAESAEAAIEYLARHKPDVTFMDHMMPGMDGFQAVQSIKNNPRTSAIPILMYTSQEGDLYLGQARALGAEGVLPKQIKQADVTRMLYQLRLIADRRGHEQSTFTRLGGASSLLPANESAIVVAQASEPVAPAVEAVPAEPPTVMPADVAPAVSFTELLPRMQLEIRAALDQSLQKEIQALRAFLGGALETHAERLQGDLAALAPAARNPAMDLPTMVPERRSRAAIAGWVLAVLALGAAGVMSWQWWRQGGEIAALRTDLDAAYAEVETLRARPEVVSPVAAVVEPPVPDAGLTADAAVAEGAGPAAAAAPVFAAPDTATPAPPAAEAVAAPATPATSPAPAQ
jgi:CheY-like chemotaxis protein